MSVKKIIKGIGYTCCAAVLAAAVYAFAVNGCVIYKTGSYILNADEAAVLSDVDCILVLGAAVKPDKTPSNMLYDRIMTGVNLYKLGASKDIIMSGDHGSNDYNEVETMKNMLLLPVYHQTPYTWITPDFLHTTACIVPEIYSASTKLLLFPRNTIFTGLYILPSHLAWRLTEFRQT